MSSHDQSPLFRLPQELRLTIYEYALEPTGHTIIGTHAVNNRNLAEWPIQPGLVRTCSALREEALPLYFSQHHFHVALQSNKGMNMASAWLRMNAQSCLWAFNHLRHLKLIVGSGVRDRPEEFVLDLEQRELVSCRAQLPQETLAWGEGITGYLGMRYLKLELGRMPDRREEGVNLAMWLEPVMQKLFRDFTLEDAGGFML